MLTYDNDKIRSLRRDRGLSQVSLAKKAGLSQPTISALERGEPHVKATTLTVVAAALGVPLKEILRPQKGPRNDQEALEDAEALCLALDNKSRAAWLAAGKALLASSKKP